MSLKEARRRYAARHNPPMNPDYLKQAQKRTSKIDPRDFFIDEINDLQREEAILSALPEEPEKK